MSPSREGWVRKMAIIRRPRFGINDRGNVGLTFQAYTTEHTGAQQWLNLEAVEKLVKEMRLDDITKLDGKPCWVIEEPPGGAGMLSIYDGPFTL